MKKILTTILFLLYLQCAYTQNKQYDSLKNLISSAKDDSTRISMTQTLIWDYIYSYPDSAALYIQQNILLAQKMKSDDALISAYIQYSILEQINGNYAGALQYGLQGLRITERTNNFIAISSAYLTLSDIYREAGDFEQSMYNLRKANSLLESKLNPVFEQEKNDDTANHYVYCLVAFAQTFETFNRLDSALKYGKKVQDLYARKWGGTGDTLFFSLILAPVMGNIYSKTGDFSTALKYYRNGEAIARSNYGKKDLMDNYSGTATTFKKMGLFDSSIFYANKVLELSEVAHFPLRKLEVLNLLSGIYKSNHNTDSLAKYLELTIETKDSLFNTKKVMEIQSITFNEKLRQQDIKDQQKQYQNRFRTYMLGGGLIVVLILAGILYRNNLQKQKAKVKIEKAYEVLETTQAQLIQSEKMASLGELTAGIAHEIQNPLNFVNNFSEVNNELIKELKTELATGNMQQAIEIADNIEENEEKINQHGQRASNIVKGMMEHARKSSGIKEPTDINILCDEYVKLSYQSMRAKNPHFMCDINLDLDPDLPKVNMVAQDISRVILNLVNNAFYAVGVRKSESNKSEEYKPLVIITTKYIEKTNENFAPLRHCEISISDNGNGIPDNIKDKIFQPFFTTKPTGQGTGLGLSLSYDIVKAHGGTISVESKESEGSSFLINLPLH